MEILNKLKTVFYILIEKGTWGFEPLMNVKWQGARLDNFFIFA